MENRRPLVTSKHLKSLESAGLLDLGIGDLVVGISQQESGGDDSGMGILLRNWLATKIDTI